MAELADAQDLKSWVPQGACGFDARPRHINISDAKSRVEIDARKLLKRRLGESGTGKLLLAEVAKTTFADLKKIITDDYANNERESADQLKIVLKRLDEGFADLKASDISAGRVAAYQAEQKKAGYANGTINRDMAALKRMFRLGLRFGVVASVPHIQMLYEDNVRSGFFEPGEFKQLLPSTSSSHGPS